MGIHDVLVTVYIPTRNRRPLLSRAVDSVLAQTYPAIELIIVDDSSTDDTTEYLDALSRNSPRVRAIKTPYAVGAPAARNIAIRAATGHFVTGLDDDDRFRPNRISLFIEHWRALERQGIRPSCLYSQDIIESTGGGSTITIKPNQACYQDLFRHNCVGNQIFAPTETFASAGLFDESLPAWQDLELFMRVVALRGPAYLVDLPTQVIDNGPRNDRISTASRDRILQACRLVAKKHATTPRQRQQLWLQVFSPYYALRPTTSDWRTFLRDGIWPYGIARLVQAMLHSR